MGMESEDRKYMHVVQYYETDRMGVTHNSNYLRWMEEARGDFLSRIGWDYVKLEEMGVISPVTEVSCKYKHSTTYADKVLITVTITEFNGVKLFVHYKMEKTDGTPVAEGDSVHCFLDKAGRPVRFQRDFPEFYMILKEAVVGKAR